MSSKTIDNLYNKLLETYVNKSYDEFVKESKKLKDIEYDDFEGYNGYIPYPDYDNTKFNKIIYQKKEFIRNKLPPPYGKLEKNYDKTSEAKCSLTNFTLTPNQMFIKGFMSPVTPYNSLLLFHSVGVGKTCTAISIAEQYHEIYEKKILVILSSTLIDNFKKQIFDITKYDMKNNTANLCVGTKYPDMVIDKNKMDKETLEKKINKLINEKYQFIGYKELAILMDKIKNKIEQFEVHNDPEKVEKLFNERLSEIFSDRLLIIDEAHNLRNPSETGKKQISTAFKTLLRHVSNVKLVLLTATPMFNNAKEIVWTLNLLLTNDKRPEISSAMIFDKQGNLTENGRTLLINISRGYISYMRGENPFSFPFRLFPSINKDENLLKTYPKKDIYGKKILKEQQIKYLEIVTSNMSDYQKEIYDVLKRKLQKIIIDEEDIEEDEDVEDGGNKDETVNNDLQNTMQISNIVYPSLTYGDFLEKKKNASKDFLSLKDMKKFFGSIGLESCFSRNDKGKLSYKQDIKKEYGEFLSYDIIDKYAPKMKNIIDYVIKSKGIVFIYSRYYASGIVPLALALEHIGFIKYGNNNIGNNIIVNDKFSGKRPQYIVLSRKKELSPNNDNEIAAIKSQNNQDGSIIKVVIVSKIGTEGIDFKRIREVHLLEPWFNLNRAEQIIGRAVRYCSHIDLPKSKRNVTIMFHASLYDENEESIDLRTYRVAENKQKRIIEIESILKKNSIDCKLNKNALMFPIDKLKISFDIETSQGQLIKDYKVGDYNYTSVCGYGKCVASCQDTEEEDIDDDIDESTFNKLFILDDIDLYKRYIGHIFQVTKKTYLTFDQILRYLKDEYVSIDEEVLMYTLEDMIITKYILLNESGNSNYLLYRGNKYILQKTRMSDVRMTFEEREDDFSIRKNIPISSILDQSLSKEKDKLLEKEIEKKEIKKLEEVDKQTIIEFIQDQFIINSKIVYPFLINSQISILNQTDRQKIFNEAHRLNDINIILFLKTSYGIKSPDGKGNTELYKTVKKHIENMNDAVLDSIIDRLDFEKFTDLINVLSRKHANKSLSDMEGKVLKSLVIGNVILTDKSGNIKYYFNIFTGELYCQRTGFQYKKCNPIELSKINDEYEKINNLLQQNIKQDTKAYLIRMGKDINEAPVFKIKDNEKTAGYVCQKTSSLTVDDLKKRVNTLVPGTITDIPGLKSIKSTLCYVYEIMMRVYSSTEFQRPYFIIKIDGKKKK